jgi:predicted lipoprotein with Yx(FWY)xxD motif
MLFKRTRHLLTILSLSLIVIVAFFVTACGNSGNTTTGSSSTGTTPSATTASSMPVVKTATATVNGKSVTILTDINGRTLYYFTPDTATKAACTATCASIWPPLIFSGSGSPTSATSLPGTLSVVSDANGNQVEYNGHPLYIYTKDTAPGQTNGEGVAGKWFVATTTLAAQGSPQSTPTSGGY